MAKFQKIRTAGSIAGAAMGQTNTITIQRQNRRLEKVLIQARVTINTSGDRTAVTWDAAAYQERLTRIFSEVRLKVSDKAGNNRFVIKASSATLINWARKMGQNLGRYNKAALSPSTTKNIAYDVFVPLFVRHPSMPDLVSNRTCIPLDASSINDNVVIELDTLAATPALFGCNGVTGGTTGVATITLNFIRYQIWYREMPADVGYVPQELISQNITNVSAGMLRAQDIPRSGFLSSLLFETFTDTGLTTVGDALSDSTVDFYRLYFGRKDIESFWQESEIEQDDNNGESQSPTTTTVCIPNASGFMVDFLQDRSEEAGYAPDSLYNLYNDNPGDTMKLEATGVKANSVIRYTTHKFLTPDVTPLVGL